jgi:hypothetical protein
MATKKQSFEQPNNSASGASKSTPGRKPSDESSTSPGQSTSASQSPQSNQGQSSNQRASGQGQTGQGQTGQNSGTSQGAMGQGQGATGQGASSQGTGQNKGGEQDLLQHAKHATGEIMNQVQQQAGSQIARQKDSAATDLTQVVQAVRRFGESLSGQEQGGPIARYAAEYGDKAADSLERFSTYIRKQDPKQLLNDVQNFGRRQPALLLGGAFLLGLAGARLIKSAMSLESHSMGMQSHQSFQPNAPARRPPTSPNAL